MDSKAPELDNGDSPAYWRQWRTGAGRQADHPNVDGHRVERGVQVVGTENPLPRRHTPWVREWLQKIREKHYAKEHQTYQTKLEYQYQSTEPSLSPTEKDAKGDV